MIAELTKRFKRAPVVNANAQWPKTFKARFIQPGLVHYDDLGTVLVERPALNKMAKSFIGKPVIDEIHKDATPDNFEEIADGVVIRVWTDPNDGWDWCEFLVWDEETRRHCESKQYCVSCAYTPSKVSEKAGKHNNIEYDGEFLDGTYTHLAIVKDPRYEGAIIVQNSKGAKTMFKLFAKKQVENEIDGDSLVEIDGKKVALKELTRAYEAQNAIMNLKDDDVIRVNDKNVSFKDLVNAYMAECATKKDMEEKEKENAQEKGEKVGDQKEAEEKEKEEGKKLDKGEPENDLEEKAVEEDTEKRDKIDAKNSKEKKPGEHAKEFAQVAEMRNNEPATPNIRTMSERLELGKARYGKTKKQEVA